MAETVDAFSKWLRGVTNGEVQFSSVSNTRNLKERVDELKAQLKAHGNFENVLELIPEVDRRKTSAWKREFVPKYLGPIMAEYTAIRAEKRSLKTTAEQNVKGEKKFKRDEGRGEDDSEMKTPLLSEVQMAVTKARELVTSLTGDTEDAQNQLRGISHQAMGLEIAVNSFFRECASREWKTEEAASRFSEAQCSMSLSDSTEATALPSPDDWKSDLMNASDSHCLFTEFEDELDFCLNSQE